MVAGLSPAEARVASLVGKGLSSKDAALKLHICEKTVKYHLTSIFKRLKIDRYKLILIKDRFDHKLYESASTPMCPYAQEQIKKFVLFSKES